MDKIGYVYMRVANAVAEQIESGVYSPGDRLPGEIAMAAEFRVARLTVRRALRELRERGLVVTLRDKGTYVADSTDTHPM